MDKNSYNKLMRDALYLAVQDIIADCEICPLHNKPNCTNHKNCYLAVKDYFGKSTRLALQKAADILSKKCTICPLVNDDACQQNSNCIDDIIDYYIDKATDIK